MACRTRPKSPYFALLPLFVARWVAPSSDEGLHPQQVIEIWEVEKSGTSARMLVDCDTLPSLVCVMTSKRPVDGPPPAAPPRPSPLP